ncbi:MAG TPA: GNAT family N-acetyltransferase [Chitinophagaceae bacterium]|jgi:putative acetyltransferase|nr:GNAT family N-acetyltransferase [Chitinophagaceae bacterium]
MENILIRQILPSDDPVLAIIIRETLTEFGLNKPGTVYSDETTDHLFELFKRDRAVYYVATKNNEVLGGAGIFPSTGLPEHVCELVKMYLIKSARGMGLGKKLVNKCFDFAKRNNYSTIYIETMPELMDAIAMYRKFGFEDLHAPLGNTGHYGCEVWMKKEI